MCTSVVAHSPTAPAVQKPIRQNTGVWGRSTIFDVETYLKFDNCFFITSSSPNTSKRILRIDRSIYLRYVVQSGLPSDI